MHQYIYSPAPEGAACVRESIESFNAIIKQTMQIDDNLKGLSYEIEFENVDEN